MSSAVVEKTEEELRRGIEELHRQQWELGRHMTVTAEDGSFFELYERTTITDQMDLLREQVKMLAGAVALCTS